MMLYLLQSGGYMQKEKNAFRMCDCKIENISYDSLSTMTSHNYIPIGTVEYVEKYCQLNGITLPKNISYPTELCAYLKRQIHQSQFQYAKDNEFVKPIKTKVFTGGIKRELSEPVSDTEPVWISEPIDFLTEFRYYVIDRAIVGYSQYNDGEDTTEPDISIVRDMVNDYKDSPIAYSIDVGVSGGDTVLIEVNDGWSLELYPWGTMTNEKYAELITRRWKQIIGVER